MRTMILFILLIVCPTTIYANDTSIYNDCILSHLNKAKLKLATQLITQSCVAISQTIFTPNENKRAYYDCLLENLPEVEDETAVKLIEQSCKEKNK